MANRKPPIPPARQRAILSDHEKRTAIQRLEARVAELKALDIGSIEKGSDPPVKTLQSAIENTISAIFGPDSHDYAQLLPATELDRTAYKIFIGRGSSPTSVGEIRAGVTRGRDAAIALLQQAANSLKEELQFSAEPVTDANGAQPVKLSNEVFVVHGHDDAARLEVCALLTKAGLQPIVLHEQPNKGMTVIEKLEQHSNVGFAVILLTPDDQGGPDGGPTQPRARQNVIAELFYFIGKLGRARVCALKKGELEIPSDIGGVVYVPFDSRGGWRTDLLRELEEVGYDFDWGKALR